MDSQKDLVNHLINTNALHSPEIIKAFLDIDRSDFVRDYNSYATYEDFPLSIGNSQTISQPTTVAMMLEMLSPKQGNSILDIGSGSGWTTAMLAHIAGPEGSVTGLERVDELVKFGSNNLDKYHFNNATILKATDRLGIEGKKFDRILVSASAQKFPAKLTDQLKPGGKLVIPVKNSIFEITKREDDTLKIIEHYGFVFVPLIYS
ncbi:protein-L-isoaspartate O-methyltransferase family protein [Sulfurimonas marina]|uniref:Protein-L-isoaspartate O-methyltransferase n=1 Tax=Sulfurimonas marina TaxID=2590551 RepID=A0A7M1AVY1_9BACT|nr:methyltransferase domain-containing protein [Sulfurimonas marina]QOP41607.1 methyltransferase domain-containing protein [Sulfurimonas marina]